MSQPIPSRYNAETVKQEMRKLANMNLGKVTTEKPNGGGRAVTLFSKVVTEEMDMEQTLYVTTLLAALGIDFTEFENY